jgi:hypothetical protein
MEVMIIIVVVVVEKRTVEKRVRERNGREGVRVRGWKGTGREVKRESGVR